MFCVVCTQPHGTARARDRAPGGGCDPRTKKKNTSEPLAIFRFLVSFDCPRPTATRNELTRPGQVSDCRLADLGIAIQDCHRPHCLWCSQTPTESLHRASTHTSLLTRESQRAGHMPSPHVRACERWRHAMPCYSLPSELCPIPLPLSFWWSSTICYRPCPRAVALRLSGGAHYAERPAPLAALIVGRACALPDRFGELSSRSRATLKGDAWASTQASLGGAR